jgi:hypothetical protein
LDLIELEKNFSFKSKKKKTIKKFDFLKEKDIIPTDYGKGQRKPQSKNLQLLFFLKI